jgi:hypothetical protein
MDSDKKIEVSPQAQRVIENMHTHVAKLGDFWGPESPEYNSASRTLLDALANMLRLGGRITTPDGESLEGVTYMHGVPFVYGIIFHPNHSYGSGCPQPGTWSTNS